MTTNTKIVIHKYSTRIACSEQYSTDLKNSTLNLFLFVKFFKTNFHMIVFKVRTDILMFIKIALKTLLRKSKIIKLTLPRRA